MNDVQGAWIISQTEMARQYCGPYWYVALAIVAHESNFGNSRLASEHNNLAGIKAVGKQTRADHIGHRHFSAVEDCWASLGWHLRKSSHYALARERWGEARLSGRDMHSAGEAMVQAMFPNYCPLPTWPVEVCAMLSAVHCLISD